MRGIGVISAVGLLAACIPAGDFACEQSMQCSRFAEGMCQADGRCSYPDERCPSGQRYSDLAGPVASTCVPLPDAGDSEDSTGPPPNSCEGIDCDGRGTCVVVDEVATCACEAGLYSVGVRCLDDPCESVMCRFVDADLGDDEADGSRQTPWRTIERLEQALTNADPGDHFLLRRGQQWSSALEVEGVMGGVDRPVVIGAYGPLDEPKPRLFPGSVGVGNGTEQLVIRDLWIEDDPTVVEPPNRPCVGIGQSVHVVIVGNTVAGCVNRGIRVGNNATFTVIADNTVKDLSQRAGIFVADAPWADPPQTIGPHHWIIDNVVTGIPENGITVEAVDPSGDIKVVGNTIADVTRIGLAVEAAGWVWAVGNVIVRAGDDATDISGGLRMIADGPVTGNVLLHNRYGLEVRNTGEVLHNTIVHEGSAPAVVVPGGAQGRVLTNNLVLVTGGSDRPWVQLPGSDPMDDVATMDLNWYATEGEPCVLEALDMALDLAGFVEATGFDAGSQCDPVPGFGAVPTGLDPSEWDGAFWQSLQPDARWSRCSNPAGARDCNGEPLEGQLQPIDGYFENDGLGWEGPLLVRQRYGPGA
ncbi:MAG: right-handed parallel beta-helix repeat-containing protein [Myxococcota bacterium]